MATVPRVRRSNLEEGRKYMNWSFLVMEGIMKAWVALINFRKRHIWEGMTWKVETYYWGSFHFTRIS